MITVMLHTKQINLKSIEQSKPAVVNTIDVAGRFHYNTLLFQLMINFSRISHCESFSIEKEGREGGRQGREGGREQYW